MIFKEIETFHYLLDIDGYRIREITLEEVQQRRGMHCEYIAGYSVEGDYTKCNNDDYPTVVFQDNQVHVIPNFKTKEELKKALAAGETVKVHSPGWYIRKNGEQVRPNFHSKKDLAKMIADDGVGPSDWHIREGRQVTIEGPHGPVFRKWYARAYIVDNKIVKLTRGFDIGPWRPEEAI